MSRFFDRLENLLCLCQIARHMNFCRQAILLRLFLLESSKQILNSNFGTADTHPLYTLSQPRFIPVKHHRTVDADRRKIETQICQIFYWRSAILAPLFSSPLRHAHTNCPASETALTARKPSFSPTLGTPGILSAVSPISAFNSIKPAGVTPYFASTSAA